LLEEVKQNAEHLSILNEVGTAVSKIMDLPDLLEVIYEQGRKSISLDSFFVGLYHPDVDEVSFPIMYDSGVRFEQTRGFVTKNSFLRRFLNGEKSILMLRTEAELTEGITYQKMLGKDNKLSASLMAAPLISRDQVIGVVSAQSYTLNAYDESDLKLLEGIANQVSIAIENSRLYTAAQQEIAERQKVEEQLRLAEAKYRELVERVPAVIYSSETGATGRWFYVSPQIETLLGFTPEEWLANPDLWYQQIHPDDREYAIATEAKLLAEGSSLETEYRIYTKDRRLLWIHDESMSVSVSDNQFYVVQGFLTDITVRKQAELTLKESEEKYHSLFLTADRQARELTLLSEVQSALAQELDLSDLIRTVVEAIAKTFGYIFVSLYKLENGYLQLQHQVGYQNVIEKISSKEGISGKVVNAGHPVLIKDVTQEPDFLRASPHIHSEICVPLFDGDEIFGTLNVESSHEYQLTEEDLRLMQVLSEQVNIAIRRARLYADRAESLRREKHINEFAHAISSTLDLPSILEIVARLSVDLIGAETGTVSLMSDDGTEMTNIYNYNEDPSLDAKLPKGLGLTWLVYEKGRHVIVDEYSQHPNAAPDWSASGLHAYMGVPIMVGDKRLGAMALYNRTPEKKFTQRDVSLIEALAQEVAISIQNAHLFVALQKELTEHKQTQSQLQVLVHELEAKNAELERFTYSVSHDLKSPLVTIGGFLGFLEADIQKGEIQRIETTIKRIREAAKKMHRLLDEILELSRIGRLINPPVEVPFVDLVNEALELAHGQLTEKQVEVKIEAELPIVKVDRIRMVEVLQNLIVNATKFTQPKEKPILEIGSRVVNDQRAFFVKDNGIGIAPEYHQKVFGLFDKLDAKSEGTGIGLALVKRIIEVHGGTIWVESETGKGATFFFTLEPKKQQENL
jgi:PAS domain S-box-containing protein